LISASHAQMSLALSMNNGLFSEQSSSEFNLFDLIHWLYSDNSRVPPRLKGTFNDPILQLQNDTIRPIQERTVAFAKFSYLYLWDQMPYLYRRALRKIHSQTELLSADEQIE
jgi:hypothetical protein